MIATTGWPTYRTTSRATKGRRMAGGSEGTVCATNPSSARSSPVNTASTPGTAFASLRSMPVMRAWACVERT